ncbi:hypothetical protein EDB80DRAFT_884693 [Ilyonectria destructans]|nr:hypothetical protein EDB80DRAFT_884693 [Ilyonectria destructans]
MHSNLVAQLGCTSHTAAEGRRNVGSISSGFDDRLLSAPGTFSAANKILDTSLTLESMTYVWLANFYGPPSASVPAGFIVPEDQERAGQEADES